MKPDELGAEALELETFSILERIDVGETSWCGCAFSGLSSFSILERIDVGETSLAGGDQC